MLAMLGVELDRSIIARQRLIKTIQLLQRIAAVVMRIAIVRPDRSTRS